MAWKDLRISEGLGNVTRSLIGSYKSNPVEVDATVDLAQKSIIIGHDTYYPEDQTGKKNTKLTGNCAGYTFKIKIANSNLIKSVNITIHEKYVAKIDSVSIDLGDKVDKIGHISADIEKKQKEIDSEKNRITQTRLETELKNLNNSKNTIENLLDKELEQYTGAIKLFLQAYPSDLTSSLKEDLKDKGGIRKKLYDSI